MSKMNMAKEIINLEKKGIRVLLTEAGWSEFVRLIQETGIEQPGFKAEKVG